MVDEFGLTQVVCRKERVDIVLQYWRIWLLLVIVLGACLAIGLKPQYTGVQIAYVSDKSPAKGILEQGMIIYEVNGERIYRVDEWDEMVRGYKGNITLTTFLSPREKKKYTFEVNETIGIDVIEIDRMNLDFGLDIKGGTRIVLQPKENATSEMVNQIISTLQTRANIYGLREIRFFPLRSITGENFIQIEAAGLSREVVTDLLSRQGNFEAKITKPVFLTEGKGKFQVGEREYEVELLENGTIRLGNLTLEINDTFALEGIEFQYLNVTSNEKELIFLGLAYKGEDIELVYSDPQHSGIIPRGKYFSFYFVILVSEKGAERFAKITSGIPSQLDLNSGEYYLKDCRILLYLDKNLVSSLRISSSLGGKIYTTPQIEGSRETREQASLEKLNLQTILRSGALPVGLETVSVGVVSPTLGKGFVSSAMLAAGLAAIVVVVIVFVRYKKLKIAVPLVLTGFSEIIIILGVAANNDWIIWAPILVLNFIIIGLAWWKKYEIDVTAWIGAILIPLLGLLTWTIDLPAIGGIIAAIGIGVDNMIVIADETLTGGGERKILYTIKDKIKRAFFIIFGSASTTIAAMVPLMSLGIGLVRGFAITTIIGVLVGILITRPAYARIIEMGTSARE
jgi:preprotein translocase subunit SecD